MCQLQRLNNGVPQAFYTIVFLLGVVGGCWVDISDVKAAPQQSSAQLFSTLSDHSSLVSHSNNNNRFVLHKNLKRAALTFPVEYYFDSSTLSVEPNVNWEGSVKWTLYQDQTVNLGFDDRVVWLRIPIDNQSNNTDWLLEFEWPLYESVDVFYRQNSESSFRRPSPLQQHRFPLFALNLAAHQPGVILLRLTSMDRIYVPLTLYHDDWFNVENIEHVVIMMFLIGILLAMALYNILLGFKTRDITFIQYSLSQVFIALALISLYGFGNQFLWPNSAEWTRNIFYAAVISAAYCYGVFTISFLRLDKYAPQCALWIRRVNYGWGVSLISFPFFIGFEFTTFLHVYFCISYLSNFVAALYCMKKNPLMARYHVAIFALIIAIVLGNLSMVYGLIPRNYFTTHLAVFASAFEALLFSFALGERMNILRQQNFEMAVSSRIKSDFLSQMSHEIRTPMNGIIGMSELLSGTELTARQLHYNRVVRSSGESLLTIVNDILDFSKIEAQKMDIEEIEFSIEQLSSDIVAGFYCAVKDKGIELFVQIDPAVPDQLVGDPTRIRQIIVNLISNAIKFTVEGYVLVSVSICSDNRRSLDFSVQDTGCGIPSAAIDKLFSAFMQVDNSTTRKYGGTGLGLAISHKLVELMGGEIGLVSREGEGCNFHFRIPVIPHAFEISRISPFEEASSTVVVWVGETLEGLLAEYFINFNVRVVRAKSLQELFSQFGRSTKTRYLGGIIDRIKLEDVDFKKIKDFSCLNENNEQFRWIFLTSKPTDQPLERRSNWIEMTRWGLVSRYYSVLIGGMEARSVEKVKDLIMPPRVLRILCAEDNTVNQLVIKGYVKKLGHELVLANNGQEAVETYTNDDSGYDLLLMDCEMPVLDGFEATRSIRSYEQRHDKTFTPIIAITAHGFDEQKEKCFDAGMNDHLAKPITLDALQVKFAQYIGRQEGPDIDG